MDEIIREWAWRRLNVSTRQRVEAMLRCVEGMSPFPFHWYQEGPPQEDYRAVVTSRRHDLVWVYGRGEYLTLWNRVTLKSATVKITSPIQDEALTEVIQSLILNCDAPES